jgi:hypothetical protein
VRLLNESGDAVAPGEPLVVAMASNTVGRFAATALPGEPEIAAAELPVLVRDAVAGWLLQRGTIRAADFAGRWQLPPESPSCGDDAQP